jgi:hypothetical protein
MCGQRCCAPRSHDGTLLHSGEFEGKESTVNGRGDAPSGGSRWRADTTPAQLLRAAAGLEEIADACAGLRRDELLEMAGDLRERAFARRAVDAQRSGPLRALAR